MCDVKPPGQYLVLVGSVPLTSSNYAPKIQEAQIIAARYAHRRRVDLIHHLLHFPVPEYAQLIIGTVGCLSLLHEDVIKVPVLPALKKGVLLRVI